MCDENSRLNRELETLQRELSKKNSELERLTNEVERLAITDPLTGLYNRRGFFDLGDREIERAKRFRKPLSAIMLEIDFFKRINDAYGHAMGDQVLKEIAMRCSSQLRRIDILGRYGGDEFVALLPETNLTGIQNAADRLRQMSAHPIKIERAEINVTISLGGAVIQDPTASLQELLGCADQALRRAKDSGRNCVCVYDDAQMRSE
jgi:eukaryotic-like serine/threonine-protein kinase